MRVLIEFGNKPIFFEKPCDILCARGAAELSEFFAAAERRLAEGYYLAGFFSYEAGYAFEPRLERFLEGDFPLAQFGCYRAPVARRFAPASPGCEITDLTSALSPERFSADIDRIKAYIAAGDVYQITFCRKLGFGFQGDAYALYRRLLRDQPVPYPAYVETGPYRILSLSPEMFLHKKGERIVTKPMKGSWPCGRGFWADMIAPARLHLDAKNRAENVMIADLLRNDLGRLGYDVRAPRLFEVARYRTICQMTSTVTAKVDPNISVGRLFRALFPSGSVTGAPKLRAMQIIHDLEQEPRKIYTGAIGFITPEREMVFNVPIRTILLTGNRGELGIGGGIIWDSTPEGEWAEGEWKARFFSDLAD